MKWWNGSGKSVSILNCNVNVLNHPKDRVVKWIKVSLNCTVPTRDWLHQQGHRNWEWREEKMFHPNGNQRRKVVVILTSDKVDF